MDISAKAQKQIEEFLETSRNLGALLEYYPVELILHRILLFSFSCLAPVSMSASNPEQSVPTDSSSSPKSTLIDTYPLHQQALSIVDQ